MRKIFLLFTFVAIISCEDATEIIQEGELNDAALYTSVENMQLVLNDVYNQVNTFNEVFVSSLLTDEVALGDSGFPSPTHNFQIFSTNDLANAIWITHYRAINRANRLINGSQLVDPSEAELTEFNNILAQARAIRAFCHFQLLTYFSPDITNDSAFGVMLVDFVPSIQQAIPRSTVGEVVQLIEDDLQFAEENLTTATQGANSWHFFNVNVVNAIRARMYLYRENYTLAEQFADELIDGSGIDLASCQFTLPPNFPLTTDETSHIEANGSTSFDSPPPAGTIQFALFQMDRFTATTSSPEYRKMWVDAVQGESIFSLLRPNNVSNLSGTYNTNQSYILGGPLWDMGRNLYNLYTEPMGGGAQDFRRWSFVDRSATISSDPLTATQESEVIVIDKYPGKNGNHSSNDIKVFRMSEMYFIKAECRIENGDLTGAANLIQEVRQARNYIPGATVPTPSYSNATEAFKDVLDERYKELCFEGHRYIDLKRMGAKAGVTETNRFPRDSENSSATNPANISVDDFRFTLPIPQNEINGNPIEQNPGY